MLERYGHRTVKKLMQATELFYIEEEPTPGGGTRTVYRIDPRFELHIQRDEPAPQGPPRRTSVDLSRQCLNG